jgi:hypothetical protein
MMYINVLKNNLKLILEANCTGTKVHQPQATI